MNRDDIIKMAQEAGCYDDGEEFCFVNFRHIERFAARVAASEREECARVADRHSTCTNDTTNVIAIAIRARGEK